MYKKFLAFVAAATVCMSASAAITYTQYNFDGSDISGYFVQRDDNKAIANYRIQVHGQYVGANFAPFPSESNIVWANNNFTKDGPTSFTIFDELNNMYHESLSVYFESDNDAYGFHAMYKQEVLPWANNPSYDTHPTTLGVDSIVTKSAVDPIMAAELNSNGGYIDGINQIIPTRKVPEPASLALLAIGAIGAAGAARRRKAAR